MKKSSSHQLNLVITLSTTNGGTTWLYRPLDLMQHDVTVITYEGTLPKVLNLNIIKPFDPTSSLQEMHGERNNYNDRSNDETDLKTQY